MGATSITIPRAVKGEAPSLIQADYANQLIDPLNAILRGKVAPLAGTGSFYYAGGEFILDLTAFDQRFRVLEAQYAALANRVSAVENDISNITSTVNGIISALSGASISSNASCDNAGTITVSTTLTIPNIPAPL